MNGHANLLMVKDLTVTFERWGQTVKALDAVSLTVPQGQWLILVGANGSGKSTLLRAISTRLQPSSGQVFIKGKNVKAMSPAEIAHNVFHVHQDPLLGTAPTLTIFENLAVADHQAQIDREPKHLLEKKYQDMLTPLGLNERMKQPVRTLSGGERQLLALLIARLRPASLILLDEPLVALDPVKTELCLKEIVGLNENGKTLIYVTHNVKHAVSLGDRTVALHAGQIVFDETADTRSISAIYEKWSMNSIGVEGDE